MNKTSVNPTPILHSAMPKKTDNMREVRYHKQWENNSNPKASTQFHTAHCAQIHAMGMRGTETLSWTQTNTFFMMDYTIGSGHPQKQLWCRKFFLHTAALLPCSHTAHQHTRGRAVDSKILGSGAKAEFESRVCLFPVERLDDVVYLTPQPSS